MKHYYKNALYVMLCLFVAGVGYAVQDDVPTASLILYILSIFMFAVTFFEGISDSVKDGIERAKKEENKGGDVVGKVLSNIMNKNK